MNGCNVLRAARVLFLCAEFAMEAGQGIPVRCRIEGRRRGILENDPDAWRLEV